MYIKLAVLCCITLFGLPVWAECLRSPPPATAVCQQAEAFTTLAKKKSSAANKQAFGVASFQFALEACLLKQSEFCQQVSAELERGIFVPHNHALANRWLLPAGPGQLLIYQQTLSWLRQAQLQKIALPEITAGQCQEIEWRRTLTKVEPLLICRRSLVQQAHLTTSPQGVVMTQAHARTSALQMADSERASEFLSMDRHVNNTLGRSLGKEWFILSAMEPRFGCTITSDFDQLSAFYNPCHGDRWDQQGNPIPDASLSDHVTQPLNVPPYSLQDDFVVLGRLPNSALIDYQDFAPDISALDLSILEKMAQAARWQQLPLLRKLLASATPDELHDKQQRANVLIQALSAQYMPSIQLLLEHDFNPTEQTRFGTSARTVADVLQNPAIFVLLKDYPSND